MWLDLEVYFVFFWLGVYDISNYMYVNVDILLIFSSRASIYSFWSQIYIIHFNPPDQNNY